MFHVVFFPRSLASLLQSLFRFLALHVAIAQLKARQYRPTLRSKPNNNHAHSPYSSTGMTFSRRVNLAVFGIIMNQPNGNSLALSSSRRNQPRMMAVCSLWLLWSSDKSPIWGLWTSVSADWKSSCVSDILYTWLIVGKWDCLVAEKG